MNLPDFKNHGRYTPDTNDDNPDTYPCGICETSMPVVKNRYGPTGSVEAMARHGHYHDRYECPNRDEQWHKQALALHKEIEKTPSQAISNLLTEELILVLTEHKATKEKWSGMCF